MIRMVRNYGNMAFVTWTAEIYSPQGYIKKRVPGYSYNRVLRKARRWESKHFGRLDSH